MRKSAWFVGACMVVSLFSGSLTAKVPENVAERLKKDLTPLGAIRAGNQAGTIPPWTGGIQTWPEGYEKSGQHHIDPFADDKVLFEITAQNYKEYADNLTVGIQAMFETYPTTFKMPVYQSRRSQSAPQWVYDYTYQNALKGELNKDGTGLLNAFGGIPFPILPGDKERAGMKAIWNHITRFRGINVVRSASEVAVQRNGNYNPVSSQQEVYFAYSDPEGSFELLKEDNVLFYYLSFTKAPARLAGGAVLVHETLDQIKEPRQAWGYNAGQRRVRRAPNLAYDTPIAAADGLRTADDTDMFNGAPDRYNWEYKGLQEMYIPYNSYKLSQKGVKYKDLLQIGHLNPDLTRYELHRVHVVEATLKEEARHIYSRRTFYLDEDSWGVALADQYDARGELWRVSAAYLKNFYDVPTTWTALDVFHDLQARRYHVQNLDTEERTTIEFKDGTPNNRYYKPSSLRRRGR